MGNRQTDRRTKPGRRYRLLLYERLYRMVRWQLLLIALGVFVLWWRAPFVPLLALHENWLLLLGGLNLLIFLGVFVARISSFVQCHPSHLRIQTALYRLAISYQRIQQVRPVAVKEMYPASQQSWSQRHFLEPLFGLTGVGVNLKSYPQAVGWLRLWLNEYMFTHDAPGLLFLVEDWMALSREIDDYRERWTTNKTQAARPVRVSQNPFLDR